MGLFDRISRLLRSNINDAIDKSEDPEKMLKQVVADLNEDLLQVKTQVASSIATEKQLGAKYKQFSEEAEKWQAKAEIAVDKGEDELAREALKRKNTAQQTADGFKEQWDSQRKAVGGLKDNLAKLESKISEASTKKDLLIARHRRADAEKRIHQTLSKSTGNSALGAFERMESRVSDQEAQAAAYGELASDSLEDRFAALGSGPPVDDELAKMKAAKEAKLLGAGGGANQTDEQRLLGAG